MGQKYVTIIIQQNEGNVVFKKVFFTLKILNQRIRAITKKQKLKDLIIYPYSISNILVKEASYKLGFKISLVKEVKKAKIIIGLKKHLKYNFKLKRLAKKLNIPIFNLHQNSVYQLIKLFRLLIY